MVADEKNWTCVLDYNHVRNNLFTIPLTAIILIILELLILCGNGLVVAAVVSHRSLQTTTNYIITSLAFSDLALGIFVLPFSIWKEITHIWGFGETICNMWLAMDVWLCTASIYNVVAISFDRFMAVTQPLKYKLVKSSKVGRILVSLSWVLSFAISLPPLVIWSVMSGPKEEQEADKKVLPLRSSPASDNNFWDDHQDNNITAAVDLGGPRVCDCTPANNSDGYILYSAMGSFIVPLIFILVFNGGIYKAVLAASATITVQVTRSGRRRSSAMILRVHRGGDSCTSQQHPLNNSKNNKFNQRKQSCRSHGSSSRRSRKGHGGNQQTQHLNKSLLLVVKKKQQKPSSLSLSHSSNLATAAANNNNNNSTATNDQYHYSNYHQNSAINNGRGGGSFATFIGSGSGNNNNSFSSCGAAVPYAVRPPPDSPEKPFFRNIPSPLWAAPSAASPDPLIENERIPSTPITTASSGGNVGHKSTFAAANGGTMAKYYSSKNSSSSSIVGLRQERLQQGIQQSAAAVTTNGGTGGRSNPIIPATKGTSVGMTSPTTAAASVGVGGGVVHKMPAGPGIDINKNGLAAGAHYGLGGQPGGTQQHQHQHPPHTMNNNRHNGSSSSNNHNSISSINHKKPVSNGGSSGANHSNSGMINRERAEQRVAKTVAIVVGCYLICWMPFAIVYLLQAYDTCTIASQCIPAALFTTIIWLGYANSALNPIIYALFSRDFRRAFKRVLLTIIPTAFRQMIHSATHTRQNSRSTMKPSLLPTYHLT